MVFIKLSAAISIIALSLLSAIVHAAPESVPSPFSFRLCSLYDTSPAGIKHLSKTNRGSMKAEGNGRYSFTNRAGDHIFQVTTNPLEIQNVQEGAQKQYAIAIQFDGGAIPMFKIGSYDHCKETSFQGYYSYFGNGWLVTDVFYYEIV